MAKDEIDSFLEQYKDIDTQIESLDDAAKKTVDYLYKVEGDCPPELYQAIATLRQLINEEFKPEKSLSSQFIFNIINPAIKTLLDTAVQEANEQGFYAGCGIAGVEAYAVPELYQKYRKALKDPEIIKKATQATLKSTSKEDK